MKERIPYRVRTVFASVWFFVCILAAASCFGLGAQLVFHIPPLDSPYLPRRLLFTFPVLLGGLAALYGAFSSALSGLRNSKLSQIENRLRIAQKRLGELEEHSLMQRTRIEELSTLREIATAINQESDFTIIAEKVLELMDGLLQPLETTIFLHDQDSQELQPFAYYAGGNFVQGANVPTRTIPDFSVSQFESHSIVSRIHGQELHAIVPLKVNGMILGATFLVFPTGAQPPQQQLADFDAAYRRVLLGASHHISLAVKTKHLHTRAIVDSLTRLYSRSHFQSQFRASINFASRNNRPLALALMDIDHFKDINDTHGHATGDVVLARLAGRLQRSLRKYDTAYRYGGEEFAVLLPETSLREAAAIAERIRLKIGAKRFRSEHGKFLEVTVSFGVAQFQPPEKSDVLFERADKRLYRAKNNGRNQVIPRPGSMRKAS